MEIILGNIVALIASILMVYVGVIKEKKRILYVQTIQIILSTASNIILGGITGAIINLLGCIRNILCYYNKLEVKEKVILIFLSVALSLIFNNMGFIGLLPIFSIITYTVFIDINDVVKFKILIILSLIAWFVYDLYIKSYVAALFDFVSILANIISIVDIQRRK